MSLCLLHVYDVSKTENGGNNATVQNLNAFGRFTALGGAFHGGIEVNGKEWSYGYCASGSGVYFCDPKDNPMYVYRETVTLGATTLSKFEVNGIIAELKERWLGKEYDMMTKNCNHFCVEFAEQLRVSGIPGWLNRMAVSAETVTTFGAQTAEQVRYLIALILYQFRWFSGAASAWLSSWSASPPAKESSQGSKPARQAQGDKPSAS